MKRLLITLMALAICAGCATTPASTATKSKVGVVIDKGSRILHVAAPLIMTGTCLAYPEYCAAAKAAYIAAKAAHAAMGNINDAESGTKLATLAQEFTANIDVINDALVKTGQTKVDTTEFIAAYKEAAAVP